MTNKMKRDREAMQITVRQGGVGHQDQKSWPFLSKPYGLNHAKNEFSLVEFTACQSENSQRVRESVQKQQWVQI